MTKFLNSSRERIYNLHIDAVWPVFLAYWAPDSSKCDVTIHGHCWLCGLCRFHPFYHQTLPRKAGNKNQGRNSNGFAAFPTGIPNSPIECWKYKDENGSPIFGRFPNSKSSHFFNIREVIPSCGGGSQLATNPRMDPLAMEQLDLRGGNVNQQRNSLPVRALPKMCLVCRFCSGLQQDSKIHQTNKLNISLQPWGHAVPSLGSLLHIFEFCCQFPVLRDQFSEFTRRITFWVARFGILVLAPTSTLGNSAPSGRSNLWTKLLQGFQAGALPSTTKVPWEILSHWIPAP